MRPQVENVLICKKQYLKLFLPLRFVIRSNLKLAQLNVIPLSLLVEKLPEGCLLKSWTRVEDVQRKLVCGAQP